MSSCPAQIVMLKVSSIGFTSWLMSYRYGLYFKLVRSFISIRVYEIGSKAAVS